MHGDRIKVGRSIFVFVDQDDVDSALLKLTEAEKKWYVSVTYPRLPAYEAAKETVLDAFLHAIASINDLRTAEEILERVFELIFQVSIVPTKFSSHTLGSRRHHNGLAPPRR